jgi:hypothetical protein
MQLPKTKKGFALIVVTGGAEIAEFRYDGSDEWMVKTKRTPVWLRDYDQDLDLHFEGNGRGGIVDALHVIASADKATALPDPSTVKLPDAASLVAGATVLQTEIARSSLSNVMKAHCAGLFSEHHVAASTYRAFATSNDFGQAAGNSLKALAVREGLMLKGMHDTISNALGGIPYRFVQH